MIILKNNHRRGNIAMQVAKKRKNGPHTSIHILYCKYCDEVFISSRINKKFCNSICRWKYKDQFRNWKLERLRRKILKEG